MNANRPTFRDPVEEIKPADIEVPEVVVDPEFAEGIIRNAIDYTQSKLRYGADVNDVFVNLFDYADMVGRGEVLFKPTNK